MTEYRLPKWVANKGAIVVPKSAEGESFLDACVISANMKGNFENKKHIEIITKKTRELRQEFDFSGGSDFDLFVEKNSGIGFYVYILSSTKEYVHFHNYTSGKEFERNIEILWDKKKDYFSVVKNSRRLLCRQVGGRFAPILRCLSCGDISRSHSAFDNHKIACSGGKIITFRERDKDGNLPVMKFTNYHGTSRCHNWGAADSEDTLKGIALTRGESELVQEHNACAWGCVLKTLLNAKPEYIQCFSEKPTDEFVKKLIVKACLLFDKISMGRVKSNSKFYKEKFEENDIPIEEILMDTQNDFTYRYSLRNRWMTDEVKKMGKMEMYVRKECSICGRIFSKKDIRVIDHDHFTGEYLGIAHQLCNSLRRSILEINIFMHNAPYDNIELLPSLMTQHFPEMITQVKGINKRSSQKFLSLTLRVPVAEEIHQAKKKKTKKIVPKYFDINFRDSYGFFKKSLAEIIKNLKEEDFKTTLQLFSEHEDFKRVSKKHIFPFGAMKNRARLFGGLPERSECFDELFQKKMSESDYNQMVEDYEYFGCENMMEYLLTYLKGDCTHLFDALLKMSETNIKAEGLDPRNFLTFPQLSFCGMLKKTGVEMELFPSERADMFNFFNDNRRGGFTTCVSRYCKANHKYLKNYDPSKPSIFIFGKDFHGLYSAVECTEVPLRDYTWMTREELDNWEHFLTTDGWGCHLECDIEKPLELHDYFNDYPPLPEHMNGKLIAHLWDTKNYVGHYEYIKSALDEGYILKKIHRGVKYREEAYIKEFVEENNRKRAQASSKADGNMFKLKNNSFFGKTSEDKTKFDKMVFTSTEEDFQKATSKPNYRFSKQIEGDKFVHKLETKKVVQDRPVPVGQTILDKSKIYNTNYWYKILKKVFGVRLHFIYGDTDSQYFWVKSEDAFEELKDYVHLSTDTAVYENIDKDLLEKIKKTGFPVGLNKDKAGYMADEHPGDFITEIICTASKEYYVETESGEKTIKAKGIGSNTRDVYLTKKLFYDAVFHGKVEQKIPQAQIRSFDYKNYTVKMEKKIFGGDDKRILLPDGINTLAHGHWRDLGDRIIPFNVPLPEKGTPERKLLEGMREAYRKKLFG